MTNILLHGLGQDSSSWKEVKELLAECGKNVFIPDLFKMAKSPLSYSVLYDELEKICKQTVDQINICGLSMGGVLALNYANRHPEKVNSLVLIGIPYIVPQEMIEKQNAMFEAMPEEAFGGLGIAKSDFIRLVNELSNIDIPGLVEKISCRCLVICGENDTANLDSAMHIHEKIGDSNLVIIKESGHEINKDNPKDLAKEIGNFINNNK